jgi:ADP-ribosylglycohydrolase
MIGWMRGLFGTRLVVAEPPSAVPAPRFSVMADRMQDSIMLGALADAYGYVIEFRSADEIERDIRSGFGFRQPDSWSYDGIGHVVSDDTQMTLFTAEACVRAIGGDAPMVPSLPGHCQQAYLAWYRTQTAAFKAGGGLAGNRRMHQRRAPGGTCLQALARGGRGTPEEPINDSKGCGGLMRVAPIAFLPGIGLEEIWSLGCASAALTHGHVLGWSTAGAFAVMLRLAADGLPLAASAREAASFVAQKPGGTEIVRLIEEAMAFTGSRTITRDQVERLGGGWVAEECLLIGLAAALMDADIATRISVSAHHSGDSDSTASVCGQLIGASLGRRVLEEDVLLAGSFARLDVADAMSEVLGDLAREI